MKAAVLYEANTPLVVKELSQEAPRQREVLLDVSAAGLCLSDHHIMHGTIVFPLPSVLGHEGAGTVAAVGPGVTAVKPGDRCILSFVSSCGQCSMCRSGRGQLCDAHRANIARMYDGTARLQDEEGVEIVQLNKLGVFAESVVVPEQACFPIPDAVPSEVAALMGCCVTTGFGGIVNQPDIRPGASVAVFGCGGVGLNTVQGARTLSASRIIAVDIHDHKLEFARGFGATDVVNARKVDPVVAVRELSGGGVDFAFDTIGGGEIAAQALDSVRKGGTAVVIGLAPTEDSASINVADLTRDQKRLQGSYYGSASPHQTFGTLVDLYLDGRIDVESLVQRRYSLEEINEGFAAMERGDDGRGVIIFE